MNISSTEDFYASPKIVKNAKFMLYTGLIGFCIVTLLSLTFSEDFGPVFLPMISAIIMGSFQNSWVKSPLVSVHNDYIEMKLAPLASKLLIPKNEITDIAFLPKKIVIQRQNNRKINIPLSAFEKEIQTQLKDKLNAITPPAVQSIA